MHSALSERLPRGSPRADPKVRAPWEASSPVATSPAGPGRPSQPLGGGSWPNSPLLLIGAFKLPKAPAPMEPLHRPGPSFQAGEMQSEPKSPLSFTQSRWGRKTPRRISVLSEALPGSPARNSL